MRRRTFCYDFLVQTESFPSAAGGMLDLQEDERISHVLAAEAAGLSTEKLRNLAGTFPELQPHPGAFARRSRARFARSYARMEEQVGSAAGNAILTKVDSFAEYSGHSPPSGIALEAGGGAGLLLPDFCRRFDHVVFLDCSLVNIFLAHRLAHEWGLSNVSFVRGDAQALPFQDGSFDFVHEYGVIEHVARPRDMLEEGLRVTGGHGTYVCVSPNRFSITPEPHFRFPLYGIYPPKIRRLLIRSLRGVKDESGTDPRSLRELREYTSNAHPREVRIFFLPPTLTRVARPTVLRRGVQSLLQRRRLGGMVLGAVNGPLLGLMPYHVLIACPSRAPQR
ncbi:MAG: class I SAM-dependent methyltransferase [Actinomycetota bacterium]|nr:class I SAM-dependent methyltransferase [Actinomycetota bacterium]